MKKGNVIGRPGGFFSRGLMICTLTLLGLQPAPSNASSFPSAPPQPLESSLAEKRASPLVLSARMATDRFRNVPTWYPTWGMQLAAQTEASATPLQDLAEMPRNLRLEGGVAGQVLPRNDVLDLYTATLFAGGAWTFPVGEDLPSPFVGTRLLGGGVWHSRGQGTLDGGAELRLGLEAGKFSAALGAGVTRHFHRLGLEMGLGL